MAAQNRRAERHADARRRARRSAGRAAASGARRRGAEGSAAGARALSAAAEADAEYWRRKIAQVAAPAEDGMSPGFIAEQVTAGVSRQRESNASLLEAAAADDDDAGGGCCGCWPFGSRKAKAKDPAREIYSL